MTAEKKYKRIGHTVLDAFGSDEKTYWRATRAIFDRRNGGKKAAIRDYDGSQYHSNFEDDKKEGFALCVEVFIKEVPNAKA